MTVKSDVKFEEELSGQFKIDMKNLMNFDPSHFKITKICTLMGFFEQTICLS